MPKAIYYAPDNQIIKTRSTPDEISVALQIGWSELRKEEFKPDRYALADRYNMMRQMLDDLILIKGVIDNE